MDVSNVGSYQDEISPSYEVIPICQMPGRRPPAIMTRRVLCVRRYLRENTLLANITGKPCITAAELL